MLELVVFPKRAERKPWELFFVGLLYATLSFWIVKLVFSNDVVLSNSSGMLVVMFSALFSIIFFFFALRLDEKENIAEKSDRKAIKDDWKILKMFLWLFFGFVVAFVFWQVVLPNTMTFNSQMQTYCVINKPLDYMGCLDDVSLMETLSNVNIQPAGNFPGIFVNNVVVALSILIFSLIFGAGVIFIIAWNASIIGSVIAFSSKYVLSGLPLGLLRFLVHGIPEIAAYFCVAMAGGMASFALMSFIRKKLSKDKLYDVIRRSLYLIVMSFIILVIAALIEVYITPFLF
jgi:uncharacterized membrane protein SpoIIM required for sporulation